MLTDHPSSAPDLALEQRLAVRLRKSFYFTQTGSAVDGRTGVAHPEACSETTAADCMVET